MILCKDFRSTVSSVCTLSVFATPGISAGIRSAVVETIFLTRTGAASAFDLVSASKKIHNVPAR